MTRDVKCGSYLSVGRAQGGGGAWGGEVSGMRHVQLICKRCDLSLMDPSCWALIGWSERMRLRRRSFFPVRTDLPYLRQKNNSTRWGKCSPAILLRKIQALDTMRIWPNFRVCKRWQLENLEEIVLQKFWKMKWVFSVCGQLEQCNISYYFRDLRGIHAW